MILRILPLYIRMWIFFLFRRTKLLTEKDLTSKELSKLKEYLNKKYDRNMYLSFGTIRTNNLGEIIDLYSFAYIKGSGIINWLNNLSYKYQVWTNYYGYQIKIKLT